MQGKLPRSPYLDHGKTTPRLRLLGTSIKPQRKSSLQGPRQATERRGCGHSIYYSIEPFTEYLLCAGILLAAVQFHHVISPRPGEVGVTVSPISPMRQKRPEKAGTHPRSHRQSWDPKQDERLRLAEVGEPVTGNCPRLENEARGRQHVLPAGPQATPDRAAACSPSPGFY